MYDQQMFAQIVMKVSFFDIFEKADLIQRIAEIEDHLKERVFQLIMQLHEIEETFHAQQLIAITDHMHSAHMQDMKTNIKQMTGIHAQATQAEREMADTALLKDLEAMRLDSDFLNPNK